MQTSKSFQKTKVYTNIQELSKFLVASPGKWASDFGNGRQGHWNSAFQGMQVCNKDLGASEALNPASFLAPPSPCPFSPSAVFILFVCVLFALEILYVLAICSSLFGSAHMQRYTSCSQASSPHQRPGVCGRSDFCEALVLGRGLQWIQELFISCCLSYHSGANRAASLSSLTFHGDLCSDSSETRPC